MKVKLSNISFNGMPKNYRIIDKTLSRSAQPLKEDFIWLKEQGVTDIINFRTMIEPQLDYEEKEVVENLGLIYHNIPSITFKPNEEKVEKFLKQVDEIKNRNGKVHIHCKAGADRTGMYSFIYKMIENIGTLEQNKEEWIKLGHNRERFPNLIDWAIEFLKNKNG